MGKQKKKHVPHNFKQKHPKNKETKLHIAFDEGAREEFLTGFRKRKNERRKKAQEELLQRLKGEKKRIREKKKARFQQELPTDLANWNNIAPSQTYNLAAHTVTVTDVTEVDFVGSGGFMLGSNMQDQKSDKNSGPTEIDQKPETKDSRKPASKGKLKKAKLQEQKLKRKLNLTVQGKKRHRKRDRMGKSKKRRTK